MKISTLVSHIHGEAPHAEPELLESDVTSIAVDSREIGTGGVFFALAQPDYSNNCFNGDFADSHPFVADAFARGATACVVRRDRFDANRELLGKFEGRLIFVDDCIAAMQRLAHCIYKEWNRPVIGITGSAGKTTAKELTAHVLEASGRRILKTFKNYNNGIGLPLTVFSLLSDEKYDAAVLEMGMSTPNREIARLCTITPPDIAVELSVLPVHIEHLGTIENIQKAKRELVEGLKPGGTAVLNADDARVAAMAEVHHGPVVKYGIEGASDVSARNIRFRRFGETLFTLKTPEGSAEVVFSLNGRHNIMNALAAASVGHVMGMTARDIATALSSVRPPAQRGEVLRFKEGITVINDTYNSNPAALVSMVSTLKEGSDGATRTIVIAGEMRELGDDASKMHFETGVRIAEIGVDELIGIEGLARELISGAQSKGLSQATFFADSAAAADGLKGHFKSGDLVLVKGSRGVRTEKVVEMILESYTLE